MNQPSNFEEITKMYEKLTYLDQYGGSVILFIIISIIIFLGVSYCFVMINAKPIIDDWPNQRCHPSVIPFAGLLNKPDNLTISEFTSKNFDYCVQDILSSITGNEVQPLTYITIILESISRIIQVAIQKIRAMFNNVRNSIQSISREIMGRIINIITPLQQIIISFRDLIGKIQGTMTAGLFTLLGSYFALQSFMGAIAEFIIIILIGLVAIIAVFWIFPFTWGAAIANTAIFIAISIPMIIILAFMKNTLHVQTNLSIPRVRCFDKNTLIKMNDNSEKPIFKIEVGDILLNNNEVTAIFKVETDDCVMYNLNNIYVSDSHKVFYNNNFINVSNHPNAIKNINYNEPYLYCLNTTNKTIIINDIIFSDWDEIYENNISKIITNSFVEINKKCDIHNKLDGGFASSTKLTLINGNKKNINDINVGDILENGEKVYGVVEINGQNIEKQFQYILGEKLVIEGGPNLVICDSKIPFITTLSLSDNEKIKLNKKHNKLYHLLTNNKTFKIGNITFKDYNAAADIFLEKED
jgi:hypothetical protein